MNEEFDPCREGLQIIYLASKDVVDQMTIYW